MSQALPAIPAELPSAFPCFIAACAKLAADAASRGDVGAAWHLVDLATRARTGPRERAPPNPRRTSLHQHASSCAMIPTTVAAGGRAPWVKNMRGRLALDADILVTPEHLAMRQSRSRAVMNEFKAWLDAEQPRHPPRGAMGEAIGDALGSGTRSRCS